MAESAGATAIPRQRQPFGGPGRRSPVSVAHFGNDVSEYAVNHRPGRGQGRRIPVSVANSRKSTGVGPRAGGGTATISTSKTRLRCLFRRCFFLVRAPVACRRPPPGASGPPLSWVFTLRGARTGVPHANWATWLSDVPGFCGPAGQKRPAARETDDLAPQRTDKTRQNRRTRLRFLDSVNLFTARDVEPS